MLLFHIFAGYGALKDKNQTLLLNSYDPATSFYERFEAEKAVKQIAVQCPHSYNIAIFGSQRDPEKHTYAFYSHEMANQYVMQETVKKEEEERKRKGDVSGRASPLASQASKNIPTAAVTSNEGPLERLSDEGPIEEGKEEEVSIQEGKVTYTNTVLVTPINYCMIFEGHALIG